MQGGLLGLFVQETHLPFNFFNGQSRCAEALLHSVELLVVGAFLVVELAFEISASFILLSSTKPPALALEKQGLLRNSSLLLPQLTSSSAAFGAATSCGLAAFVCTQATRRRVRSFPPWKRKLLSPRRVFFLSAQTEKAFVLHALLAGRAEQLLSPGLLGS